MAKDPGDIFRQLAEVDVFNDVIKTFEELKCAVGLTPGHHSSEVYPAIKRCVNTHESLKLYKAMDGRRAKPVYGNGTIGKDATILVIGGGPCGMRTAIECALLGARVVVVELRNYVTRNNVLHLWPWAVNDLKAIGTKVFYPKFCVGSIHHVSIRRLQLVLLKIALVLGVEIHSPVTFEDIVQPNPAKGHGWRARVSPPSCPVNNMDFNVVVGADGKTNSLDFPRKFTRGKVSIAITANFKNPGTGTHLKIGELPGVISINRPDLFSELTAQTGLQFDNFVYFRDETHYFIMTAKKKSLMEKGIVKRENADLRAMFHPKNINTDVLLETVRKIAITAWKTDNPSIDEFPELEFVHDRYGKEDVAIFDFAALHQAEYSCLIKERHGKKLLHCIVGDTVIEPFWPTGSGIAKGFLTSLDATWTIRNWLVGDMSDLEVIANRESIFRLLPGVTPTELNRDINSTIDPKTRYVANRQSFGNMLTDKVKPNDVLYLYNTSDAVKRKANGNAGAVPKEKRKLYRGGSIDTHRLIGWFKEKLKPFVGICQVNDLGKSWNNGLALCALIQSERPDLIDVNCLDRNDCCGNIQKAFDILENEFGVEQMMAADDLANRDPDRLTMMSYLFHIYEFILTKNDDTAYKQDDLPDSLPRKLPKTISASSIINTLANSDVLLNTLRRDAERINNLDIHTLAMHASNTLGVPDYYLKTASLDRRAKNKLYKAVKQSMSIKPGKKATEKWKKRTKEKIKERTDRRARRDQFYEQVNTLPSVIEQKLAARSSIKAQSQKMKDNQSTLKHTTPEPQSQNGSHLDPNVPTFDPAVLREQDEGNAFKRGVTFADSSKNDDGPSRELTEDEKEEQKNMMSLSRQACGGVAGDRINAFKAMEQHNNTPPPSPVMRRPAFRGSRDLSEESPNRQWRRSAFRGSKTPVEMSPGTIDRKKRTGEICCICDKKLFIVERQFVQGHFLHRHCFKCKICQTTLRIGNSIMIPDENDNPQFYCCGHAYQAGAYDVKWKGDTLTADRQQEGEAEDKPDHTGPLTIDELQYMASDDEDYDDSDLSDTDIDFIYNANLDSDDGSATLRHLITADNDLLHDITDTSNQLIQQEEIQQGLDELEDERDELEQKGIELEKKIRGEIGDRESALGRTSDDLINAWLNINVEKKELKEKESKLMIKLRLMTLQERLKAMLEMMPIMDDDEADTLEGEISTMENATDVMEKAAHEHDFQQMVDSMKHMKMFLQSSA